MDRTPSALSVFLCVLAASLLQGCGSPRESDAADKVSAEPGQRVDERMDWWRDARLGMFIHWGLYAIPAGSWGERDTHGEWIRTTAQIPLETYNDLQPQWNPVGFDADAWARMAAAAGMKYLVITSKHHDGFCLFDSAETDWDVMNTPHGRDILAELKAACDRHGVRFCTYHSIMDWHHPDYLPRRGWETDRSIEGADFDRFERYLHAQVTEVVAKYDPAVMWFDGEWENTWSHERGVRLWDLCRSLSPSMIVNNRVDVFRGGMAGFSTSDQAVGDFQTPEQEIPATGLPGVDWESCMTMNSHWGWNAADTQWKSSSNLIRNLIDIASKGGNYLLNVGPRADGTFPPQAVERLRDMGQWMERFGDAVYGTTASVFDELEFGRCTVRREGETTRLFLHVFAAPESGQLQLPGLGSPIRSARILGNGGRVLDAASTATGWSVAFPADALDDPIATVVEVVVDGPPIIYRSPTILAASTQFVGTARVGIESTSEALSVHYTVDGSEPTAASPRFEGEALILRESSTVRARSFHGDRPVAAEARQQFEKVTPQPGVAVADAAAGLRLAEVDVAWDEIPSDRADVFDGPQTVVTQVALPREGRTRERVARRYSGFIKVAEPELYHFALASDDGSMLWIHGKTVVDNNGLHGTQEKRGAMALDAGWHPVELVCFNKTGGAELSVQWSRDGVAFEPVPPGVWGYAR